MENMNLLADALKYAGLRVEMENDHTLIVYHPYKDDIGKGMKRSRMISDVSRIFNPKAVIPVCDFKATIITF